MPQVNMDTGVATALWMPQEVGFVLAGDARLVGKEQTLFFLLGCSVASNEYRRRR